MNSPNAERQTSNLWKELLKFSFEVNSFWKGIWCASCFDQIQTNRSNYSLGLQNMTFTNYKIVTRINLSGGLCCLAFTVVGFIALDKEVLRVFTWGLDEMVNWQVTPFFRKGHFRSQVTISRIAVYQVVGQASIWIWSNFHQPMFQH